MSFSYNYPPQMAYPSAPPVYRGLPAPPRLHWAWVLLLCVVTMGLFVPIWLFVQARWVKKATGRTRPFAWTLAYLLNIPLILLLLIAGSVAIAIMNRQDLIGDFSYAVSELSQVWAYVLYIASVFMLKSALEAPPIKIPLHGLGTLFFGPVYFQYFLSNYSVEGKLGEQLSGFGEPAAAAAEGQEVPPQA